jgi:hypothetical protein
MEFTVAGFEGRISNEKYYIRSNEIISINEYGSVWGRMPAKGMKSLQWIDRVLQEKCRKGIHRSNRVFFDNRIK